jgi:hypothetical protein
VAGWYVVTIGFAKTPKTTELEAAVFDSQASDWIRFNSNTWIVYANHTAVQWYEILRVHLTKDDNLLVMRVQPNDYYGWAPEWIWKKLQEKH